MITMSRIAKNPVQIPTGVSVALTNGVLSVKGKLGELSQPIHSLVSLSVEESEISFELAQQSQDAKAMSGTMRALVSNMVLGVSEGFSRQLKMVGVGYRAAVQGKSLNITAGFSHPVSVDFPEGISVETPSNTDILIKGFDKQKVCQFAANIRSIRPPEPYKGKGIRYHDEQIILKEGKKK